MLDLLLDQTDRACKAGIYVLALMGAIVVPDICAALRSPDGETTADRYRAWYDDFAAHHFGEDIPISAKVCYKLRCRLLHQGIQQGLTDGTERVFFCPTPHVVVTRAHLQGALWIDVPDFCSSMAEAAREWERQEGNDPQVKANAQRLIQLHPNGLQPYTAEPVVG
jgi:hypothetical protein